MGGIVRARGEAAVAPYAALTQAASTDPATSLGYVARRKAGRTRNRPGATYHVTATILGSERQWSGVADQVVIPMRYIEPDRHGEVKRHKEAGSIKLPR